MSARGPIRPALVLVLLALFLVSLPEWARLPEPASGLVLTEAFVSVTGKEGQRAQLPYTAQAPMPGPAVALYELSFDLPARPAQPQNVYIPALRHSLSVSVNGRRVQVPPETPWMQPAQGVTTLFRVPPDMLHPGQNRMSLTLSRAEGGIPFYLGPVHFGEAQGFGRSALLTLVLAAQGSVVSFVLHLVVLLGLLTLWSARRHDPVFRWLALLGSVTFCAALLDLGSTLEGLSLLAPAQSLLMSSFGLMVFGMAMAIAGRARPAWLVPALLLIPLALLVLVVLLPGRPLVVTGISAGIAICGHLAASLVLAVNFWRTGRWEQGLLAVPFFLVAWIGLRDIAVVVGLREAPFLLTTYVRPLTMLAVVVVLMRRLASSLNSLDAANDTLRQRLAEQERQLSTLHERERRRAAETVREDERQRLTRDLHDGLSGHLVSIIALSERGADTATIERSARAALDDLRLVINSLDIGERDLPLALAGFRERLEPQLRRLGVGLDWSMEKLPEIDGVTPGNALSVLRIMQEAVTNALKHGPARHIRIEGGAAAADRALIVVSNDCPDAQPGGPGHGMNNMLRRARAMGGEALFEHVEGRAVLTLSLPLLLADA